jgi:hypothetical protein
MTENSAQTIFFGMALQGRSDIDAGNLDRNLGTEDELRAELVRRYFPKATKGFLLLLPYVVNAIDTLGGNPDDLSPADIIGSNFSRAWDQRREAWVIEAAASTRAILQSTAKKAEKSGAVKAHAAARVLQSHARRCSDYADEALEEADRRFAADHCDELSEAYDSAGVAARKAFKAWADSCDVADAALDTLRALRS